jgi:uncharacterized protein
MQREFSPRPLDVRALAQAGASLSGVSELARFARLLAEVPSGMAAEAAGKQVRWTARGESLAQRTGAAQAWLHVEAGTNLPMICQRCMAPVEIGLSVKRAFRFVADEKTAATEDEEAEEDILVFSRDFDLLALIEDELIMEMPLVPRHDVCPADVKLAFPDEESAVVAPAPSPFAALAGLKGRKSS